MEVQNFLLKVGQGDKKLQLVFLVNSYEAVVEALSVSFFFFVASFISNSRGCLC